MEEYFKEQIKSLPRPATYRPGPPSTWSHIEPSKRVLNLDILKKSLQNQSISLSSEVPEEAIEELGDNDIVLKSSAVNVSLLTDNDPSIIDSLLLMKRSMKVSHHKGQISFPGGMREENDASFVETALRETSEEIGIDPSEFRVIGELNNVSTRTRENLITPIVTVASNAIATKVVSNKNEVDQIHDVTIEKLVSPDSYFCEIWDFRHMAIPIHIFCVHDKNNQPVFVWGATAQIIVNLLRCL